ncbi:uncharacterized protein LOC124356655 [Homalodisca vitripennis]|nr:uncharacterized protein LOC124356655 [Homalodisca vitripennis]
MTTRTKEEQELLDLKIARIQKQNDEILRRKKEIEEDKRLAEQHNAVVKLRPSTNNASRERTPALKPSRRELREDFSNEDSEPVTPRNVQASSRGSFRGRGGERFRGQGDWKANGPPPDPKSFLYDDERDAPFREKEGRGDARRGRRGEDRGNTDSYRGGREFLRGGRRGGIEHRGDRGRRGGGANRDQEAWKAERMRIDEARIQRQRSADGKWRREWDSDKTTQGPPIEEPLYQQRRPNPNSLSSQDHRGPIHPPQSQLYYPPDNSDRSMLRGGTRGGKGRGRLGIKELEIPLEKFKLEIPQKQVTPPINLVLPASDDARLIDTPLLPREEFELTRSIEVIGNSVKVSIPNSSVAQLTPKSQRQMGESRSRLRSQISNSSQSDEDAPRDRGQKGGRKQRNQRYPKNQSKNSFNPKDPTGISVVEDLPAQNKPPLPPFRSDHRPAQSTEGEESWEDVTTSGAESVGEELLSSQSSPIKMTIPNTMVVNSKAPAEQTVAKRVNVEDFEKYLDKYLDYEHDRPKNIQKRSPLDSDPVMKTEPSVQTLDKDGIDMEGFIERMRIKSDSELTEVNNHEQSTEVQSAQLQSDLDVTGLHSQDLTGELQITTEGTEECTSLDISYTISEIEKSFVEMHEREWGYDAEFARKCKK